MMATGALVSSSAGAAATAAISAMTITYIMSIK